MSILIACADEPKEQESLIPTHKSNKQIENYRVNERMAQDSISKYGLDSISEICVRSLYEYYGDLGQVEFENTDTINISECDIRLYKCEKMDSNTVIISYEIFKADSMPLLSDRLFPGYGMMISQFEINANTHKFVCASTGISRMMGDDFIVSARRKADSPAFKSYVISNMKIHHPKFSRLIIDSNGKYQRRSNSIK